MMGWRTLGEHGPLNQVNRAHIGSQSYVWGLHGSASCSLHICWCFGGTLNSGSGCGVPLTLLSTLGMPFLLLESFVQPLYEGLFLVLSCLPVLF